MTRCQDSPRRLIVLGSTGSIGRSTLDVADHLRRNGLSDVSLVGLAAHSNARKLVEQAKWFGVQHLAITEPAAAAQVRDALPDATVWEGSDAARKLVEEVEATDVAAAIVGAAGIPSAIAAIERGCVVHLANKETLVAAGELVTPLVEKHNAQLIPVDSEHSAIFQCLAARTSAAGDTALPDTSQVKRLVLTASGGPFRDWPLERIAEATPEEALKHPTWDMGPKVTIDSASMTNKALELIEAHWLFGLPGDRLDAIIHPQSVIHSFVEFTDHAVLAQLGPPDMRTPIQYALTWPERAAGCSDAMDWRQLTQLDFQTPDDARFPALGMAYDVLRQGGTAGAVFNAANEAAVEAFLARQIRFGRISELVRDALEGVEIKPVNDLGDVMDADRAAREHVRDAISGG